MSSAGLRPMRSARVPQKMEKQTSQSE